MMLHKDIKLRLIIFIALLLSSGVCNAYAQSATQASEQQLINQYRSIGVWRTDFDTSQY